MAGSKSPGTTKGISPIITVTNTSNAPYQMMKTMKRNNKNRIISQAAYLLLLLSLICSTPVLAQDVEYNISGETQVCEGVSYSYGTDAPGNRWRWTVTGGSIQGSSTASTVSVKWNSSGVRKLYVTVSNTRIEMENRAETEVFTRTILPGSISGNTTICRNTPAVLSLTGNNNPVLRWEYSADGINWTILNNSTHNLTSQPLSQSTQFRAVTNAGSCGLHYATVTVNLKGPDAPAAFNVWTNCAGIAVLSTTSSAPAYRWYNNNGELVQSGNLNTFTTPVLNNNTIYYVSAIIDGCESPRTAITALTVPAPGAAAFTYSCNTTSLYINENNADFTNYWQTTADGISTVNASTSYSTTQPGTIYLRKRRNLTGCWSPAKAYPITIEPGLPPVPVATSQCSTVVLSIQQPVDGTGKTYYWQNSAEGTSMTSKETEKLITTSGKYYLRTYWSILGCWGPALEIPVSVSAICLEGQNRNFIMKQVIRKDGIRAEAELDALSVRDNARLISYTDGFGRTIQTVAVQGSCSGKDIVKPQAYDQMGRERRHYLPYTTDAKGRFQADPFNAQLSFYAATGADRSTTTHPWSETVFENSSSDKVIEEGKPGEAWQPGTGHTLRTMKYANAAGEVPRWIFNESAGLASASGFYAPGDILITQKTDEDNVKSWTCTNKLNQTVMEKKELNASETIVSVTVFDELGRARIIIQPEGMREINRTGSGTITHDFISKWCFTYTYDEKGRTISKKVPGAAPVYFVYNRKNKLVLQQDGELRKRNAWIFTKYDAMGREIMSGEFIDAASRNRDQLQLMTDAGGQFEERTAGNPAGFGYTVDRSFPTLNATSTILTVNHYDDYDFDNDPSTTDASFITGQLSTDPVPDATNINKVTGTRVRVLGTETMLLSSVFYNNKGQQIQKQSANYPSGREVLTTRYDFNGLTLEGSYRHEGYGTPFTVYKTYIYDHAGRATKVQQQVNAQPMFTVADLSYNEAGELTRKVLAPEFNNGTGLETQIKEYNIRGWSTGINRSYAKDKSDQTHYFGYELGYDQTAVTNGNNVIGNYGPALFTGSIAGTTWKTKGDNEIRKYRFQYDNYKRLLIADFDQYTEGSFNKSAGMDFSVEMGNGSDPASAYDHNGNILAMTQKGRKLSGAAVIDQLSYQYGNAGNLLQSVTDAANDKDSKLGDFHYDPTTKTTVDYQYDLNGNILSDGNTGISSITYNYLNLPSKIVVKDKGQIEYVYNATGEKLAKIVTDNTVSPVRKDSTVYLSGSVYKNDTLQFFPHEEGRVRFVPADSLTGKNDTCYFDFYLKDHQGNIRMVLTTEQQQDLYPAATMETASRATEETLFANLAQTAIPRPAAYPADNYTSPNDMVAVVNGSGKKIGPSIAIKVMAGDKFSLRANSWYLLQGGSPATPVNPLTDLLTTMSSSVAGAAGKIGAAQLQTNPNLNSGILQFLSSRDSEGSSKPKAYLSWILLDEQFNYVPGGSGAEQVDASDVLKTFVKSNLPVTRNGYLYIYCSNETPNQDVFFDNLQVTHTRGQILEETHYYPFGLTMDAISSRINKTPYIRNKYGITGKELQNNEFNDGSGLDIYDFGARMYDHKTGRFMMIDPEAESYKKWSPYNYVMNNPIKHIDPDGREVTVAHDASDEFKAAFAQAVEFLKSKGAGELYTLLKNDKDINIIVYEETDEKNVSRYAISRVGWQHKKGGETTARNKNNRNEYYYMSPAEILNHEFAHAIHHLKPKDMPKAMKEKVEKMTSDEFAVDQETITAQKLKKLEKNKVTRKNHEGRTFDVTDPLSDMDPINRLENKIFEYEMDEFFTPGSTNPDKLAEMKKKLKEMKAAAEKLKQQHLKGGPKKPIPVAPDK
ncbi:MAG: DUF6443 domain-containing protein [Pseudobacter sp.]|uniref:DUF6443 domain-containing protein n=1 Tax=Pseudobacter sp. TaxID=2045420 RepID=UPI003F7F22D7